jgi:hypothetical protein
LPYQFIPNVLSAKRDGDRGVDLAVTALGEELRVPLEEGAVLRRD